MRFAPSSGGRAITVAAMAALMLTSCRREPGPTPPVTSAAPAAATSTDATAPHGDHNPHHGGVVLMKGDLHYEVMLDRTGRAHRVWFTDAVREELPASVASDVVLTIRRPGSGQALRPGSGQAPEERIVMQIDETGESWVGNGQPVASPATATARLAFTIHQDPYWIDIPFATVDANGR